MDLDRCLGSRDDLYTSIILLLHLAPLVYLLAVPVQDLLVVSVLPHDGIHLIALRRAAGSYKLVRPLLIEFLDLSHITVAIDVL